MNMAARSCKNKTGVQVVEGLKNAQSPSPASALPIGTKYVLDGRGPFVRRYIEFPNGRRVQLATRKALSCTCVASQPIGIVPDQSAAVIDAPSLRPLCVPKTSSTLE